MSKVRNIVFFISTQNSKCEECGQELGRKAWITLDQKKKAFENLKKAEDNFRELGMDYWVNKTQEVLDSL